MTLRGAKEGTSVVHDWPHARIVVWSLRMIGLAGKQDRRIDLYRVHVLGARTQSGRHIISTACANHGHFACTWTNPVWKIIVITRHPERRIGTRLDGDRKSTRLNSSH